MTLLAPLSHLTKSRAYKSNWNQCLWDPGGEHHSVYCKSLILQQGCSSKG